MNNPEHISTIITRVIKQIEVKMQKCKGCGGSRQNGSLWDGDYCSNSCKMAADRRKRVLVRKVIKEINNG